MPHTSANGTSSRNEDFLPYLEQKQLDALKGSEFFSRYSRQKRTAVQKSALMQYALYGKKSAYLDEVPFADVWGLNGR